MKTLKWVLKVEIEVSENWVADGFEATPERIAEALETLLPWANQDTEIKVKVTTSKAPDPKKVAEIQGY